jgi:serine/threonine protein kinase/Tfp pilus assembly protein PilF
MGELRDMIGKTVSHYKILEKLGGGGMGVVYKAEDLKLDRFVALKFLPPYLCTEEDEKKRFIHEAKAASKLDHTNICTIHEIDQTEDGQIFIAMACYEGETLKQKIKKGPLKIKEALDIAIQVSEGLKRAHEKKIVHRDIKPANIFITKDGVVKLLDFGLAKKSGQTKVTKTGMIMGTAAYMSPEQVKGNEVDKRTDIWSLGVVLYEMITGQLPFRGEYDQAVAYAIVHEEPEPISKLQSKMPVRFEALIKKSLQKNPDNRYQNLRHLLDDLNRVIEKSDVLPDQKTGNKKSVPSIAVIPFVDMSQQKDQEYFCDGMAEELINALTQIEKLHVASRTSAFQFKGEGQDIQEIGRKLNVQTVLEGSVRKAGNRLRITAQLINVADGYHIWSEKYDREMEDIFAIQDEISMAIVDNLKVRLLREEKAKLVKRHTDDQEAYNLYLKGRYFWYRRYQDDVNRAIEYFQQAIEKDKTYAFPYVGMADTYSILGWWSLHAPREAFIKAKDSVKKAVQIDDQLGEAHVSLGFIHTFFDWDWNAAEREYKRALELNPEYAIGHIWYAIYLSAMSRFDEAIVHAKRGLELDHLSPLMNMIMGLVYYYTNRREEAVPHLLNSIELDADYPLAHNFLADIYLAEQLYDNAIAEYQAALSITENMVYALGGLGASYALAGQTDEAVNILHQLDKLKENQYISQFSRASIHMGLGNRDKTLEHLVGAYQNRESQIALLNVIPTFKALNDEKKYIELLERVGFA